jgi:hydroxymethylglutaryl-CoA lyase
MDNLQLIECPRDAMQGIKEFIDTEKKVKYINQLLKVGFDTIDFGSFVSPKAIPQMADTAKVLESLDLSKTKSKLLAIVANERGANDAANFDEISYLGYPFSISETFQQRNTNASLDQSLTRVEAIQNLCVKHNKKMVVYISMGFGNPYGDTYSPEIAAHWSEKLVKDLEIEIISLSDTIGVSNSENITHLFSTLIPEFPKVSFGAHLHTTPNEWKLKVDAAFKSGCRRFDGALKGFGGCPMAADDLTGNMPTEKMISYFDENEIKTGLYINELDKSMLLASETFPA